mgnify:CR=1 FL=1
MAVNIRFATEADIPVILEFIHALAAYENMEDQVIVTPELLKEWVFQKKKAEVFLVSEDEKPVGFALFFHNFSTFLGRAGLYLEDLYVKPEARGKGYGKAILKKLASIAVQRRCGRLEWSCLDWNQPSIDFYKSLSAQPMEEWTVYRLTGETLDALAKEDKP